MVNKKAGCASPTTGLATRVVPDAMHVTCSSIRPAGLGMLLTVRLADKHVQALPIDPVPVHSASRKQCYELPPSGPIYGSR